MRKIATSGKDWTTAEELIKKLSPGDSFMADPHPNIHNMDNARERRVVSVGEKSVTSVWFSDGSNLATWTVHDFIYNSCQELYTNEI